MADFSIQTTTISEHADGTKVEVALSDANSTNPNPTETVRVSVHIRDKGALFLLGAQKSALKRARDIIDEQIRQIVLTSARSDE